MSCVLAGKKPVTGSFKREPRRSEDVLGAGLSRGTSFRMAARCSWLRVCACGASCETALVAPGPLEPRVLTTASVQGRTHGAALYRAGGLGSPPSRLMGAFRSCGAVRLSGCRTLLWEAVLSSSHACSLVLTSSPWLTVSSQCVKAAFQFSL